MELCLVGVPTAQHHHHLAVAMLTWGYQMLMRGTEDDWLPSFPSCPH